MLRCVHGRLQLVSRQGTVMTDWYPELAALPDALGDHQAVLDGEVIAVTAAGTVSFEALQRRGRAGPARRYAGALIVAVVCYASSIAVRCRLRGHVLSELARALHPTATAMAA